MAITTLSTKHQTTIPMEFVKSLGLAVGARLKQSLDGNRIIVEPIPDIMLSFGIFSKPTGLLSIREETEAMELAVALEVMGEAGLE